jgi:hypothetical protein
MKRYEQGSLGMWPDPEGLWVEYAEAQAEIERLRKDFTDLLRIAANDATAFQAEIERLRDQLQRATSLPTATEAARNVALEKKVDQQQAEIERLRGLFHEHDEFLRAYILGTDVTGGAQQAIELRKKVSQFILDTLSETYVND